MRIRSVVPGFWRSERVSALELDVRLLLIGLKSYVDDNGVGIDDHRMITADLFALDSDDQVAGRRAFIREGLATLARGLLVIRYMIEDTRLIFVVGWDQDQRVDRPSKPRYPRPPADLDPVTSNDAHPDANFTMVSRDPRDSLDAVVGEEGRRGEGEKGRTTSGGYVDRVATADQRASARPLPADWTPKQAHRGLADRRGVDCDHEAEQFRAHSIGTGRQIANPDELFRYWLNNSKQSGNGQLSTDPRTVRSRKLTSAELYSILGPETPQPPTDIDLGPEEGRKKWYQEWNADRQRRAQEELDRKSAT